MKTLVTVTHLQHTVPVSHDHGPGNLQGYSLNRLARPAPDFCRFLYSSVGSPWKWYLRRKWSWSQWSAHLDRPALDVWVAAVNGSPCGYFELERQPDGSAKILLFGLLPDFIGQGIGRSLLANALEAAWQLTDSRVWLHTCSLDHPRALPNYLAAGFTVVRREQFYDQLPVAPLQPWEGADRY